MQIFLNGLMLTSFYLLMSMGLSIVYGILRVVNFAHGEIFMLGAFAFWQLLVTFHIPFFVSLVVAMGLLFAIGMALDQLVFRRFRGNLLGGFIAALGLSFILPVLVMQGFGLVPRAVPLSFPGTVGILGAVLPMQGMVAILVSAAIMVLLYLFLEKTREGRAIRALSQDSEAACLMGVNPEVSSSIAMGLGAALAAAGAGLMSHTYNIQPFMGSVVLWIAFIVVVVGGMGSTSGVFYAALLFGFVDAIIVAVASARDVSWINIAIMLLVLSFRPKGLRGRLAV